MRTSKDWNVLFFFVFLGSVEILSILNVSAFIVVKSIVTWCGNTCPFSNIRFVFKAFRTQKKKKDSSKIIIHMIIPPFSCDQRFFFHKKKNESFKKVSLDLFICMMIQKTYYYLTFKSVFMLKKKNSSCSTDFGFIPESFFLKSFKDRFGKSGVKIKETNNYYFSLLLCFNEFNKKFSFSSKIIGVINIWKKNIVYKYSIDRKGKKQRSSIRMNVTTRPPPLNLPKNKKNPIEIIKSLSFKHRKIFQSRFSEVQLCFVHVASESFERNISSK